MTRRSAAWGDVAALAARQDGVVGHVDLHGAHGLGATTDQVRHWVRTGRLERAAPRVWRVCGAPVTWRQRLRVGLLSLGTDACISHEAAAQLHGFDRTPTDRVEFTVPREHRMPRLPERVHSTLYLPPIDRYRIDGLAVTSATRTIIDLARGRVADRRLEAAIDSAIRSGSSAPAVIQRRLADLRGPGRWGCRHIDDALVHAGGHTMLERLFLELMAEAGCPRPTPQAIFKDGTRTLARVDFFFPAHHLVVEVTGKLGHSTPGERARDAQRRNELQDLGVKVYEYTWDDVARRSGDVMRTMRERLGVVR